MFFFFFQAEDGIRDLVRSRGLGDVYKRQALEALHGHYEKTLLLWSQAGVPVPPCFIVVCNNTCLLYTSDAADERSSVDLGGRRIIKKKTQKYVRDVRRTTKYRLPLEPHDADRIQRFITDHTYSL
mgnify:CR=1 FL=1